MVSQAAAVPPPTGAGERHHDDRGHQFHQRAEDQSEPGAHTHLSRSQRTIAGGQFPENGTQEKGPQHQAGNTKENSNHSADEGAPQCLRTGADAFRAEYPGDQIHAEIPNTPTQAMPTSQPNPRCR